MTTHRRAPRPPASAPDPDLGRQWERAVRALAKLHGTNAEHLLDEFVERAAIIEWDGKQPRETANATAYDLVRRRLEGAP